MKKWYLFLICFTFCGFLTAQKIKYKDLFPLLNEQKYDQAESQLRIFLSDEKNAEEANAHYQFGLLTEKYFLEGDVILDSAGVISKADTSIAFFQLAKNLIDEKELKKNDEYYQSFYRRDLRTGKFGIKLSDVHLDIEKKIESIQNRTDKVRKLHLMLASIKETENSLIQSYNSLIDEYESYNDFILMAELGEIENLGTLSDFQFSIIDKSKEIGTLAAELGLGEKYQKLEFIELPGEFDPLQPIMSTLDGTLEVHAIDDWAGGTKRQINGDINFLKRLMSTTDKELSDGKTALLGGDTRAQFPTKLPDDLIRLSGIYDPDNGPKDLIAARISENIIISLSDTTLNPDWNDSLQIAYHVVICDSINGHLNNLSSLLPGLEEKLRNGENYYNPYFKERYEGLDGIIGYLNELASWTDSQVIKWDTVSTYWDMLNNWGIVGDDKIPLNPVDETYDGDYYTLGNWKIGDYDIITYGVKKDSLIGFVARFGPDRRVVWQDRFESTLFEGAIDQRFEMDTILSAPEDIAFYLFDPVATGRHNMTVVSYTVEGGINWSVSANAENKPVNANYSPSIKQHTIFFHPQEAYPLADGRPGYIVIDSAGELR